MVRLCFKGSLLLFTDISLEARTLHRLIDVLFNLRWLAAVLRFGLSLLMENQLQSTDSDHVGNHDHGCPAANEHRLNAASVSNDVSLNHRSLFNQDG